MRIIHPQSRETLRSSGVELGSLHIRDARAIDKGSLEYILKRLGNYLRNEEVPHNFSYNYKFLYRTIRKNKSE